MHNVFARMPWSLWWFALTAVIFAFQAFPPTGVLLMLIGAPLWSVITINLGFASFVPEALFGRISKGWLLVPALWFGGYYAAAHLSHTQVAALDAEFRAYNIAERVSFDPASTPLVINPTIFELSHRGADIARNYRIPVVYTAERKGTEVLYRAARLMAEPDCQAIRNDPRNRAAGVVVMAIFEDATKEERGPLNRRTPSNICSVTMPEEPSLRRTVVEAKKEQLDGFLLPRDLYRITISDSNGVALGQPIAGVARPLKWFPMPVVGCALSMREWCFSNFMRERAGLGGDGSHSDVMDGAIAAALGLEKSPALSRREETTAAPKPAIQKAVDGVTTKALALLDAVLADPTNYDVVFDVMPLGENVSLFSDRAPAIVQAISQLLANGRRSYVSARTLQTLLTRLPRDEFQAIGPSLLNVLSGQEPLNGDTVSSNLAARLGDLGSAALPILEKLIFPTSGRRVDYAIYGLCRVGAAADRYAAELVDRVAEKRWSDATAAVYVTLKRLGRDDLIASNSDEGGLFARAPRKLTRRTITPESPPSVCTNEIGVPRLPD